MTRGAAGAGVARRGFDEDACGLGVLNDRLATVPERRSPRWPGSPSCCSSRGGAGRGWDSAVQVGGGDEELEALGVGGRGAVALVHVAAADPLRAGGHADLVARAVVAEVVPVVWVPWPWSSQGAGCSAPQDAAAEWIESCQL